MHRQIALLLFASGLLLSAYSLYTGAGQIGFLAYYSFPAWLVPVLFFALGFLVYFLGGFVEGEGK